MKSNNTLITIAVLSLGLAVLASLLVWGEVTSAVKIGMYAFGFATGVAAGVFIIKRRTKTVE